jgi:tRNA pseudouridine-54 N-methylase
MTESSSIASPSRHFIIPFSRLPCRASSHNLDLVKTRGDVWCRCLIASLMVSRGTRNDSSFTAVALAAPAMSPNHPLSCRRAGEAAGVDVVPVYLRACGRHIKCLRPEQSTCAAILNSALPPSTGNVREMFASGLLNTVEGKRGCCQGLHVGIGGFQQALLDLVDGKIGGQRPFCILLQERSENLEDVVIRSLANSDTLPTAFVFVLGDHEGLTPEQERCIDLAMSSRGVPLERASLGPTELLASQAIVIAHFVLDKALGCSDVSKPAFDPLDERTDSRQPCCICFPPRVLD